jgi:DtxR family Mn-dependent transcriptional regulator
MLSYTEENYLKCLLKICSQNEGKAEAGTNEIAAFLGVKPATATDMFKKLKDKELVNYEKYGKISLTSLGQKISMQVLRKHRLWETFLCEKLEFSWDEVHEVAEQLEHIKSDKLVDKLDSFLNFPEFDPHGDPIPNAKGEMRKLVNTVLSDLKIGEKGMVMAVKDTSAVFLQYLQKLGIGIGSKIEVIDVVAFDGSLSIKIEDKEPNSVSMKFAESLFVRK